MTKDLPGAGQHWPPAPPKKPNSERLHSFEDSGTLFRQISELQRMGASHDDLHALIDVEGRRFNAHNSSPALLDPGRGTCDNPVDPVDRARTLFFYHRNFEEQWMASLVNKEILVVGEFRPHILERLLSSGLSVTQIHPPTPEGDTPPHFRHLRGLRGVLDLNALFDISVDFLLFEGRMSGNSVYVSPLVPVVLKMFLTAQIYVMETDHRAPHMSIIITDSGFKRFPFIS